MTRQTQRLVSRMQGGFSERSDAGIIKKSYPLFCASVTDGIVLAALNPPGMPSRIDAILDRIAYGGIGNDADIDVIVREVGVAAIWKAEVTAAPEDVLAEHLANSAKELIAGGLKGNLFADPQYAEIVFVQVGFNQDEDRLVVVDVQGRQINRYGWVILPEYLPKAADSWCQNFPYKATMTMRQLFKEFRKLGSRWCALRAKTAEDLVWESAYLDRTMAREKRYYDVFQKQPPVMARGGGR